MSVQESGRNKLQRKKWNAGFSSTDKSPLLPQFLSCRRVFVDFLFQCLHFYYLKQQIFGPIGSFLIGQTKPLQTPTLRRGMLPVPLPLLSTLHQETLPSCRHMIHDNVKEHFIIEGVTASHWGCCTSTSAPQRSMLSREMFPLCP